MKKSILYIVVALVVFFIPKMQFATVDLTNSTGGGTWNNGSTWDSSSAPVCPDSIYVLEGDSVYIAAQLDFISCGPIYMIISGVIEFKTGRKLKLASGSFVEIKPGGRMIPGGGGGSSNYLEIGGTVAWTAADGEATGPISYDETGPLPVELLTFEANANEEVVALKWITASEINNDYFAIERSLDAKNWEEVIVTIGAGNSNQINEYFETDYEPLGGISYYRLKQTDFDGKYAYSNIVPVKFEVNSLEGKISLFPSPVEAGGVVNIEFEDIFESELLVVLRDIRGQEFYSMVVVDIEDGRLIGVPIDNEIPDGIYLITASSENQIYSQKLIIKNPNFVNK